MRRVVWGGLLHKQVQAPQLRQHLLAHARATAATALAALNHELYQGNSKLLGPLPYSRKHKPMKPMGQIIKAQARYQANGTKQGMVGGSYWTRRVDE